MRGLRVGVGRRVGPVWAFVSWHPGRHRRPRGPIPRWRYVLGAAVGLTFFICVMMVVFG